MITFLPYPDLLKSAICLDHIRRHNQVFEADIILQHCLTGKGEYIKHPIIGMWKGYELSLLLYREYCLHGSKVNPVNFTPPLPPWFGDPDFHKSHRENLLRKKWSYYCVIFRHDISNDWYVWFKDGVKYKQKYNTSIKKEFKKNPLGF